MPGLLPRSIQIVERQGDHPHVRFAAQEHEGDHSPDGRGSQRRHTDHPARSMVREIEMMERDFHADFRSFNGTRAERRLSPLPAHVSGITHTILMVTGISIW